MPLRIQARRGFRPHFRAGADPRHRPLRSRVERVAPVAEELDREVLFPRPSSFAEMAGLGLMGIPIDQALRRRRRRHRLVRRRDRGADADRLVRGYHGRRTHLARHDADLPLRLRGAGATVAPGPRLGAAGSPRSGSPNRMPDRMQAPPARRGPSCGTAPGSSTARRCSSPTPGTELTWGVTITARTGEDEISNLVVENGTPGYGISEPLHKLGWKASDTRELTFADCAVPDGESARARAGKGFHPVPRDPRRWAHLRGGDGRRGLRRARTTSPSPYAQERQQFGQPIPVPEVPFLLADMVTVEAGRAARLAGGVAQGPRPPGGARGGMAKL